MNSEQRALITYRMERAREALDEAELLFQSGHLHAYINRLYYACFYAVSALLLSKGYSTSKHSHLRSLLHQELVKTNILSAECGKHFDLLYNNRQKGDYADLVVFQADEISGWLEQSIQLVEHVETYLQRS